MHKIIFSYLFLMLFNIPSCERLNSKKCFDVSLLMQQNSTIAISYKNKKTAGNVFKNLHLTTSEHDKGMHGYFRLFNLDTNKEFIVSMQYSFLFDPDLYGYEKIAKGESKTYILSNPYERIMEKDVKYKIVFYPTGLEFCQDSVSAVFIGY